MKKYFYILPVCLMLSNCVISPTDTREDRYTQKMVQNGYQIETVGSHYAYPSGIQVKYIAEGLHVTGQVMRRTLHKKMSIRGHVDIEIVDTNNQVVKRIIVPLNHSRIHAEHDRRRMFSVVIPKPIPKEYRVLIGCDLHIM